MLHLLADLLYPPRCQVCRVWGSDPLCAACRAGFTPLPPPLCLRCGIPRRPPVSTPVCRRCHVEPPPFAVARSSGHYRGRLRAAIHRLKFEGRQDLGPLLGDVLADFVRRTPALHGVETVLPVPLHWRRLHERGYNHAALLARAVARAVGVPMAEAALLRVAPTLPQSRLRRKERYSNVRGAFLADPERRKFTRGRVLLLVDDVLTSGATAAACTETLLAGGASEVRVATLARALMNDQRKSAGEEDG